MKFIIEYTGSFSENTMKTDELSLFNALKSYHRIKKNRIIWVPQNKNGKTIMKAASWVRNSKEKIYHGF